MPSPGRTRPSTAWPRNTRACGPWPARRNSPKPSPGSWRMWRPAEPMARRVRAVAPSRHNGAMSRTTLPILLLAACLGMGVLPTAHAQASPGPASEASERPHYDTGDAWLDRQLADIDRYASTYPETFAAEVERYAGASRAYVRGPRAPPGWDAGDARCDCFLPAAMQT